jgi:cellulose synthase/poly-beta-1,6-N-acetylglucosamine synthase-like glycosyltransferase
MIGTFASAAQIVLASTALFFGGWWTVLSFVALRKPTGKALEATPLRWSVIVPAHNEERLIGRTIQSIVVAGVAADAIVVVADNCTDATAGIARAAGARVLERVNPAERGKSFALDFALVHLRAQHIVPEAVAIIDADSEVTPGFFDAMAQRLTSGAEIVQSHYRAGEGSTPVASLRRLALALVHWARPLGASRLGLPTTLKGNGMAFRWGVVEGGFPGEGITEDASATLEFARRGVVVAFEPNATVTGLMASTYREADVQDLRWEGGRLAMTTRALALASVLAVRGRIRASAACLELASPPLTLIGLVAAGGLGLAVAGVGSFSLAVAAAGSLVAYVGVGLASARPNVGDLRAIVHVPRFVLHKLAIYMRLARGKPTNWQRTSR